MLQIESVKNYWLFVFGHFHALCHGEVVMNPRRSKPSEETL